MAKYNWRKQKDKNKVSTVEIILLGYNVSQPRTPITLMGGYGPVDFISGRKTVTGTFRLPKMDMVLYRDRLYNFIYKHDQDQTVYISNAQIETDPNLNLDAGTYAFKAQNIMTRDITKSKFR